MVRKGIYKMWYENIYVQCILMALSTIIYILVNAYVTFCPRKKSRNGVIKPIYIKEKLKKGDIICYDGTIKNIKDLK